MDELLNKGPSVFSEVAKSQWGSYCIQHSSYSFSLFVIPFLILPSFSFSNCRLVLEHGSEKHREMTLDHLITGLLEYATNEQGSKSITKALKEGGKETLDKVVKRMCEPANGCVSFIFLIFASALCASVYLDH